MLRRVKFRHCGLLRHRLLRPVSAPQLAHRLEALPVPEALDFYSPKRVSQCDGAAVQHGAVVDPDLAAVLALVPKRPLLRAAAVFHGAVQPRFVSLTVGGVGDAWLSVYLRRPPDAAPLKEHCITVLQRLGIQAVDGRPGGLRAETVIGIVPAVGDIVGCPGIGLTGHKCVAFRNGGLRGQNGVPPVPASLEQLLRPGSDRLILREAFGSLGQALKQPHCGHGGVLIGQGLREMHGESPVVKVQ